MEGTNKKTKMNIIAARSTTTTTTSTSTTTTSATTTTTMKKETTNATSSNSTSSSREYYHHPNHKSSFVRNRRVRYYYSTTGTVVITIIVVSFLLLVHCCWQSTHSILRDDYYYQSSTNEEENHDNVNDNLLVLLLQHNNNNNNTNSHSTVPPPSSSSTSTNHQQRQLTRRTSSSSSTTETRTSLSSLSLSEYDDDDDNNDDNDSSKSFVLNTHSFPQKRPQLPNFSKTGGGGVIVFLHIAKTGGTTIRQNFGRYVDQVYKPFTKAQLDKFGVPLVNEYLTTSHDHNKTLLLELHGNHGDPVPGIIELEPYLQQWRTLSQQNNNNKSLFVFTLLREPISWYISYFNFFKHSKCHYHWCDPPLYENLTESNLLHASAPPRPNHQCTYLARRYTRNHAQMSNVTSLECQQVQQLLFFQSTIMDWVGTTEQLQTDTIPLLAYMLVFSKNNTQLPATTTTTTDNNSSSSSSHYSSFYQNFTFRATHNQRPNRLKYISQHGKEMLQRISKWDLQLYQNAQQQYQIQSLWPKDYPAIVQIQQEFKKIIVEQQQQQQKQQKQQRQQKQQKQQRQQRQQEKQQKQQEQQKQSIPLDTEKQLEQIQSLMRIRPPAAAAAATATAATATTTTTTTSK